MGCIVSKLFWDFYIFFIFTSGHCLMHSLKIDNGHFVHQTHAMGG